MLFISAPAARPLTEQLCRTAREDAGSHGPYHQKTDSDRLSEEIADLESLNTAQLRERWRTLLVADTHSFVWPPLQVLDSGVDSPTLRPMQVVKRPSFPVN